jgi:hypothetical protein
MSAYNQKDRIPVEPVDLRGRGDLGYIPFADYPGVLESIRAAFKKSGKMGGQILRLEGSINPMDKAIFAESDLRPQLAEDEGETLSHAEDIPEEQ